jgi:hypothetical protein
MSDDLEMDEDDEPLAETKVSPTLRRVLLVLAAIIGLLIGGFMGSSFVRALRNPPPPTPRLHG